VLLLFEVGESAVPQQAGTADVTLHTLGQHMHIYAVLYACQTPCMQSLNTCAASVLQKHARTFWTGGYPQAHVVNTPENVDCAGWLWARCLRRSGWTVTQTSSPTW
jgi:hypothetical protein